jgi:hypothetical protein
MNKIPCIYSIVRFSPFIETGEFANVGVIMLAAQHRFFDFKLLIGRYGRVTRFFEQLEPKVYRATMLNLREELTRVQSLLRQHGFDRRMKTNDVEFAKGLFAEVIRRRETIVQFGDARAVLADDTQVKLKELFDYYVERNFVQKKSQEAKLESDVRKWLYRVQIGNRFVPHDLGDDEYHVTFPFVECDKERPIRAIKPLHLAHAKPSKILDHGGQWIWRVGQLARRNVPPDRLLFAVHGPEFDGARTRAYDEIVGELANTGAHVVPYTDKERVLAFAA